MNAETAKTKKLFLYSNPILFLSLRQCPRQSLFGVIKMILKLISGFVLHAITLSEVQVCFASRISADELSLRASRLVFLLRRRLSGAAP